MRDDFVPVRYVGSQNKPCWSGKTSLACTWLGLKYFCNFVAGACLEMRLLETYFVNAALHSPVHQTLSTMLAVKHASLDAAGSLCATQPSQKRWHSGELSWNLKATWYAASIHSFSFIHSSSHYTHVIPDSQVCTVQGTVFALVLKHVNSSTPLHQRTAYHVIPILSFALVLKHVNSSIPNDASITHTM